MEATHEIFQGIDSAGMSLPVNAESLAVWHAEDESPGTGYERLGIVTLPVGIAMAVDYLLEGESILHLDPASATVCDQVLDCGCFVSATDEELVDAAVSAVEWLPPQVDLNGLTQVDGCIGDMRKYLPHVLKKDGAVRLHLVLTYHAEAEREIGDSADIAVGLADDPLNTEVVANLFAVEPERLRLFCYGVSSEYDAALLDEVALPDCFGTKSLLVQILETARTGTPYAAIEQDSIRLVPMVDNMHCISAYAMGRARDKCGAGCIPYAFVDTTVFEPVRELCAGLGPPAGLLNDSIMVCDGGRSMLWASNAWVVKKSGRPDARLVC